MGKQAAEKAPDAPDFTGAAQQQADWQNKHIREQTRANRPNIYTDFGSQVWEQGAEDGQMTLRQTMSPELRAVFDAQNQTQRQMAGAAQGALGSLDTSRLDLSGLPQLQDGEAARLAGSDAYFNQAKSRLDPMWQQRQSEMESRLLNQGLDPSSEAYQQQMSLLGRDRNDAYGSALRQSVLTGEEMGGNAFNRSLLSRQQGMSELLRQRELPLQQLQTLMGATRQVGMPEMPGFNAAGAGMAPQLLAAAQAQGQYGLGRTQINNAAAQQNSFDWADAIGGGGQALGGLAALIGLLLPKGDAKKNKGESQPGDVVYAEYDPNQYDPFGEGHDSSGGGSGTGWV